MKPDFGKFIGRLPGAETFRKAKQTIREVTTDSPKDIAYARGVILEGVQPSQEDVDNYRQFIIRANRISALGGDFLTGQMADVQGQIYVAMTHESWVANFRGHLTEIVERDNKRIAKAPKS